MEAVSAVEAALNNKEPIDIIFMDSIMPNMSGIEACTRIRDMGFKGTILAVTGNVLPEDVAAFLSAGATKVLAKPVNLNEIRSILCGKSIQLSFHTII